MAAAPPPRFIGVSAAEAHVSWTTSNSPTMDTGLYLSASDWARVRTDPAFVELVRLARVVNQLTLCFPPLMASLDDQSPRARRERAAAIVFAAALLHEGLITAEGLARHYRELTQYKEEFAPLFGDPQVQAFRASTIGRIRNELVFHVERDTIAQGLAAFPAGETLVATTAERDWSHGQIYFDIADDALLGALFGDAETPAAYFERVGEMFDSTSALLKRFMRASHRLIPAALHSLGAYTKPTERPSPPVDSAS
jgi:hypothetical protein